jgi:hypothetical protein
VSGKRTTTTASDALLPGHRARRDEGVPIRDADVSVDDRRVEGRRQEVLADPLHEVRARLVPGVEGALRVGAHDEDLRVPLLQEPAGARDRAAGPDAADERGDPPLRLLPDLRARCLVVGLRVDRVVVLVRLEGAGDLRGEAVGDPVVALG